MDSAPASSYFEEFQGALKQSYHGPVPESKPTSLAATSPPSRFRLVSRRDSWSDSDSSIHYGRPRPPPQAAVTIPKAILPYLSSTRLGSKTLAEIAPGEFGTILKRQWEESSGSWQEWKPTNHRPIVSKAETICVHERRITLSGERVSDKLLFGHGNGAYEFLRACMLSLRAGSLKDDQHILQQYLRQEQPLDPYSWKAHSNSSRFSIDIGEYEMLFFMKDTIQQHITEVQRLKGDAHAQAQNDLRTVNSLKSVLDFVKHTFPGAEEAQDQIRATGVASFDYLWTIFKPGQIIYEKRSVENSNWFYEQCIKIKDVKHEYNKSLEAVGIYLSVEEVVHKQTPRAGIYLVTSQRRIKRFTGTKPLTSEEIGFIPLNMIQEPDQDSLRVKLIDLARRYVHLSSHPSTIWEYEGPIALTDSLRDDAEEESYMKSSTALTDSLRDDEEEESHIKSSTSWMGKTKERVVIDNRILCINPSIEISPNPAVLLRLDDDQVDGKQSGILGDDELYLICRNRISAYLLSSDLKASDLIISHLQDIHWTPTLMFPRSVDIGLIQSLIQEHAAPEEKKPSLQLCHGIRAAGLVLLFHGPQSTTRKIADSISEHIQKAIFRVQLTASFRGFQFNKAKCASVWGTIVLLEKADTLQLSDMTLDEGFENCFLLYPVVIFLTTESIKDMDSNLLEAVDLVTNCEDGWVLSDDDMGESKPQRLWRQHISDELPSSFSESENRLRNFIHILADFETQDARMFKILRMAARLAETQGEVVAERHVFRIIRQSLAIKDHKHFDERIFQLDQATIS